MAAILMLPVHPKATPLPAARAGGREFPVRLRGLIAAGVCWAILAVLASLEPAAVGYGTHEQLGGLPCGFLVRTGWPCPTCGVTTSLAAMARGRVLLAWRAQPFGVAMFLVLAGVAVLGSVELITGRGLLGRFKPSVWWAVGLVAAMLAGWAWKAGLGYLQGEYPLH